MFPPPPTASLPAFDFRASLHLANTMGLGGHAEWFAQPRNQCAAIAAIRAAHQASQPISIIGGGSNVVVADEGIRGVLIRPEMMDVSVEQSEGRVLLAFGAGVAWKDAVDVSLALEAPGLATLAGIPGRVGAAPIQNIGAYGAEMSDCLIDVDLLCLRRGLALTLPRAALGLAYRTSHFKKAWRGRYLITRVRFLLGAKNTFEPVHHREIQAELGDASAAIPSQVAAAVLRVRRRKSMVVDDTDPNTRSCGSFFANPVVSLEQAGRLLLLWPDMPAWKVGARRKLSAAWLIEQSGFKRGWSRGAVGLSTKHTLALINRGNARAADVVDAALALQRSVLDKFGVSLVPEAVGIGEYPQTSDARRLWTSLGPTALA